MTIESIKNAIKAAVLAYTRPDSEYYTALRNETAMYELTEEIGPLDQFRAARFNETERMGILFRPGIVDDMKRLIFSTEYPRYGVMVRGPHGVGKSHSLVNLVLSLRAEGHIVTFVPDCEQWGGNMYFINAVCGGLGTTASNLGITETSINDETVESVFAKTVVESLKLRNHNKLEAEHVHWILVCDQLNRLFGRQGCERLKDVGVLPTPFSLMKILTNKKNVHSVISASANNSLSYRNNHEGFVPYDHPRSMSEDEIETWKPSLKTEIEGKEWIKWKELLDSTGGSPLQISEFLKARSKEEYESKAVSTVAIETKYFLDESNEARKKEITTNAIYCLLSIPVADFYGGVFDRKFSVLSENFLFQPVFPAVLVAYRNLFWEDLMIWVEKKESMLLATCADENVTDDVRGRLFELIVISRFRKHSDVSAQPDEDVLPAIVDAGMVFEGQRLPEVPDMQNNTLFIPRNSNFPAIDLILKQDKDVWAIQVHVADHKDVEPQFRSMCGAKGWFNAFDNIYLVYLSPSPEVTARLTCLPGEPTRAKRPRATKEPRPTIQVSAISIDDIECLKKMQWPSSTSADTDVAMADVL